MSRPLARQLQQPRALRAFAASAARAVGVQETQQPLQPLQPLQQPELPQPSALDLDPDTVLPAFEAPFIKAGKMPVGSRRRCVALRTTGSIPFEQLPYQAFQEARKILAADRASKLLRITNQLDKIKRLEALEAAHVTGGQAAKSRSLASLRSDVQHLKILADINDPLVKKRFEDRLGDMNKPIYRYYAERKWRSYDYRVVAQRIKQFHIVPDVLPKLEPTADVQLFFRRLKVPSGQVVDSAVSEAPPRLRVQLFDGGERLVTVAVVDPDVPDLERDAFSKRCHFLAANVALSPTSPSLPLGHMRADDQLAVPWLPPVSLKGGAYRRLAVFLLEQRPGERVDVARMRDLYAGRDGFSLKSMRDKFGLAPFGFTMFRSMWDDNTAAVMARHGLPGADVELRPTRVHSLKPPIKPRGWEAKRQGPKYRHLWKYTKRIRGISNAQGWIKRR